MNSQQHELLLSISSAAKVTQGCGKIDRGIWTHIVESKTLYVFQPLIVLGCRRVVGDYSTGCSCPFPQVDLVRRDETVA
jgi:hypothetical protein